MDNNATKPSGAGDAAGIAESVAALGRALEELKARLQITKRAKTSGRVNDRFIGKLWSTFLDIGSSLAKSTIAARHSDALPARLTLDAQANKVLEAIRDKLAPTPFWKDKASLSTLIAGLALLISFWAWRSGSRAATHARHLDTRKYCADRYAKCVDQLASWKGDGPVTGRTFRAFWELQFEQFQFWRDGYIPNEVYVGWMRRRQAEWMEPDVERMAIYRTYWMSAREGFRQQADGKQFVHFIDHVFSVQPPACSQSGTSTGGLAPLRYPIKFDDELKKRLARSNVGNKAVRWLAGLPSKMDPRKLFTPPASGLPRIRDEGVIKVVLTGAPSSGKTKIFEHLRSELKDKMVFVEEPPRMLTSAAQVGRSEFPKLTHALPGLYCERERSGVLEAMSEGLKYVLLDRCLLDNAVYLAGHKRSGWEQRIRESSGVDQIKPYDLIIHLRLCKECDYQVDTCRTESYGQAVRLQETMDDMWVWILRNSRQRRREFGGVACTIASESLYAKQYVQFDYAEVSRLKTAVASLVKKYIDHRQKPRPRPCPARDF